jgi:hypothetical protein
VVGGCDAWGFRAVTCHLGPTRATLVTNSRAVVDYLRNFYPVTDGAADGAWVVEATVGPIDHAMVTNERGVGYAADEPGRRLRLRAPDPEPLAITTRTSVREVMVDFCEQRRYVMLHASAVVDDRRVVIIAGDRGSGKTTLALKSVLRHGMRYLANDHLIVFGEPGAATAPLRLTTLPGPIALKVGTYLDLADRLPRPFDTEGLDLDAYRTMPRDERNRSRERVIYTYRDLGQPHPATVDLRDPATGPAVLVALARYADGTGPATAPVPDPAAALLPHVRTDWMFNPRLNQRYLPRRERRPDAYRRDAHRLTAALAERATVIRWSHHGDPGPLLDHPALKA